MNKISGAILALMLLAAPAAYAQGAGGQSGATNGGGTNSSGGGNPNNGNDLPANSPAPQMQSSAQEPKTEAPIAGQGKNPAANAPAH